VFDRSPHWPPSVLTSPRPPPARAQNDAVSLHDACVAAGYYSWGVAFATLLEHQPTLLEFKEQNMAAWVDYARVVKRDSNFAMYWQVLEAVDTEITAAAA